LFSLHNVLEATGGHLDSSRAALTMTGLGFGDVAIDSRAQLGGALFVALPGERVDGHSFVVDAVGHGARGALVRHDWEPPDALPHDVALIRVEDTGVALQRLAAWWRGQHDVRVVGITGSVGKTSTKEVIASVLGRRLPVLKTQGNFNNEIGLPLTLLKLTPEHRVAVLEMGAGYALGELTLLCEIARPEVAVVTNVGPVHLERMGSIERIALNKSELVRALPPEGTALLNGDDERVRAMREVTSARVVLYGLSEECGLRATDIVSHGLKGVDFTLHNNEGGHWPVRLSLLGRHSVHTALAAAGVARALGMEWSEIVGALGKIDAQVRLLVVPGVNGSTIIDDTYNASPDSTVAALNLLGEMAGNRIAVLGDMLELGSYEREGHIKVARRAKAVAGRLVVVGNLGKLMGEEALRSGMPPDRVFFAESNAQVVEYLGRILKEGDHVLVKGSRGLRMEEIVDALRVSQ
jgi:UDP-N-acetylmuramoyl-tripeptide--D-alanyl-D-alanine ligase